MGLFDIFKRSETRVIDGVQFQTVGTYDSDYEPQIKLDLLSLPSVAQALAVKSNDLAQLPLYLYMKTDNGRIRQSGKLAYRLYQQPNRFQNGYHFWKTVATQMLLGESFVLYRDGEFTILPYGYTAKYKTLLGEVRYAEFYTDEEAAALGLDTKKRHIKADFAYGEVFHFYTSQDESGRVLPLRTRFAAAMGLGSDMAAYTYNVYNRGGVVAGYLSTDKLVNDEKKVDVIRGFKSLFRSAKNYRGNDMKLAAADNGWKFNTINLTPQELMLIESKKDFKSDIAAIFNLPQWKLGLVEDYHYASAEAATRDYLQNSLNPDLVQIERELNSKLFGELEADYFYVEFYREKLIQIDAKTKAEIDHIRVQDGVLTKNEIRSSLNLNTDTVGDIQIVPVNMQSAVYMAEAEALKLQRAALENAKLALEVEALRTPAPVAAPATPEGEGATEAPTAANAPAEAPASTETASADGLRSLQARLLGENADTDILSLLPSIMAEVWKLHNLDPAKVEKWQDAYLASASKRLDANANRAYEINRCLNAANFEALRSQYGATCKVRWIGGQYEGQTKTIGDTWQGSLRHPPLSAEECDCYLEKI